MKKKKAYGVTVGDQVRYCGDSSLQSIEGGGEIASDAICVVTAIHRKFRSGCCKRLFEYRIRLHGQTYIACPCCCRRVLVEYWVIMSLDKKYTLYSPMSRSTAEFLCRGHSEMIEPAQIPTSVETKIEKKLYPRYLHGSAVKEAASIKRADENCRPMSDVLEVVKELLNENPPEGGCDG